eukprot:103245-Rhodomonas_salina.1
MKGRVLALMSSVPGTSAVSFSAGTYSSIALRALGSLGPVHVVWLVDCPGELGVPLAGNGLRELAQLSLWKEFPALWLQSPDVSSISNVQQQRPSTFQGFIYFERATAATFYFPMLH